MTRGFTHRDTWFHPPAFHAGIRGFTHADKPQTQAQQHFQKP